MESSSGTIYQGCWKDDVKHGPGVEVDSSGRKRYGIWLDGFQHARGVHVQSDGKKQSVLYNFGRMIQQNEFPHPQKLEKQQFQKCVATAKEAAKKAAQTASTAQQIGKNYLQISPSRMQSYLNTNLSP
uniref:Uncharacterized protein n=2 Tax=Guillardia theta TaxID=55529 RepID=A0A7S4P2S5_GUITH